MAERAKIGRPTIYTEELANRICELVSSNTCGLDDLCEQNPELPAFTTIYQWRARKEDFSQKYFAALALKADLLADEIISIADKIPSFHDENGIERIDSGMARKAQSRIAARQWTAMKLQPKRWGDLKQIEDLKNANERVIEELNTLKSRLDKENTKEY